MGKEKTKSTERKERADLVTLTAPEGWLYANADRTMEGRRVVCLKGYEGGFTLVSETEAGNADGTE